MKKLLLSSVFAGLLATSAGATAAEYQIFISTADFVYKPNEIYENIGIVEAENIDSGSFGNLGPYVPEVDLDTAEIGDDIISTSQEYIVIRDPVLNDGDGGSIDGEGDSTFGDINFGFEVPDEVGTKMRIENTETGDIETYTGLLYLDFLFVLEEEIETPGVGESVNYDIVEPFSFFDLLTQDEEDDWGLALDAFNEDGGQITVSSNDQGALTITFGIAGEIFIDPDGADTNNLPFAMLNEIDEDDTITISFTFTDINGTEAVSEDGNWTDIVNGSGNGNLTFTGAEVPEPATLGIFCLALTGLGLLQRRRKKITR